MLLFRIAILGFIASLLCGKWGDLPHPDTQVLQETWDIVSVERDGVADPSAVGYTLKFVDGEVHFQVPLDAPVTIPTLTIQPMSEERMRRMALS